MKSSDPVPVAHRVAFSEMGQARIENNLFIYYYNTIILTMPKMQISQITCFLQKKIQSSL